MRPDLTRDGTIYHGGPVASLIDIAGDMAVAVRAGGGVPTISLRVDYLRPCTGPRLLATARLRRYGRTISVSDVTCATTRAASARWGAGPTLPSWVMR